MPLPIAKQLFNFLKILCGVKLAETSEVLLLTILINVREIPEEVTQVLAQGESTVDKHIEKKGDKFNTKLLCLISMCAHK